MFSLTSVAWSPSGFILGASDGCVFGPDYWTGPHRRPVTSVAIERDTQICTSGDATGEVYAGRPLDHQMNVGAPVTWCSTSPTAKIVAAATADDRLVMSVRPW